MSDGLQPACRAWEYALGLNKRLMTSPGIAVQRELIVETVSQVISGQADLWLSEAFWRLPTLDASDLPPAEPSSDLMRQARDTRQMQRSEESQPGAALAVAIPLLARDKIVGILEAKRTDGPPFGDEELELLDCLATQSAVALQSAHQTAIEHWREQQLALVRMVSTQIASLLDMDELAHRVTDLILRTFKYYYVALFTLEPRHDILRCRASAGPTGSRPGAEGSLPLLEVQIGQGIIGHVAQTGVEILANDVSREPRYRSVDALPETRAEVALPIRIGERVLGILDVQSDRPEVFHEIDLLVLRSLTESIAIALEHASLYGDLRRRAEQISAVAEVSRAVVSFLDLDELFDEVATTIERLFGYPSVHLFTVDWARRRPVYRAGSHLYDTTQQEDKPLFSLDDPEDIISQAIDQGEMVLANDTSQDLRLLPSTFRPPRIRAELAIPLIFSDEVLGILDVQSDRQNAFDADDCFLLQALADSVAIAIRNANLYRSERWRRQVADSMREVAGLLSSDMVVEELLDVILFELERTLPCDTAAVCLLEDDDLYVTSVRGIGAERYVAGFPSDANLWLAHALGADQPVIRPTESPPDPLAAAQEFPADYSAIAAPLRAGDRQLGLLILAHRSPGRYGAESQVIMAAFGSYAAVAIENARMYQASQEQALTASVMLQVAEATQSLTTLDEVLQTVVRLAPMLAGIDRCAILLWDESEAEFVSQAAYGLTPEQQAAFDHWRVGADDLAPFDELLLDKTPFVVHDAATDARLSQTLLPRLGFESLLALPLLAQGEVLGAMLVDYRGKEFRLDAVATLHDERLAVIQGIAHQASVVIENTQLREAQQEEAYVSTALLQVAQTVANLNDLDDILSAIVRITPILVGVERCILFLWDNERSVFRPSHAYGVSRESEAALLGQRYRLGDFGLLDAVQERGMVVYPYDAPSDAFGSAGSLLPPDFVAFLEPFQEERKPRSLMAFPLSVKGDVLGAMMLEEARTPSRSHERRLEIITGIAQQAALALQNEQLQQERVGRERLERELQLAYEIQQTFIPSQLPELLGWDLAATWRAARQVAGDFYDLIVFSEGRLGLLIADVADKGMPAALFMMLTRTLLRAAVREKTSPSAVLTQVNDLLVPDAKGGMFVTAFYGVLSGADNQIAYANAGHNPPLLLRSRIGHAERLGKGGMALGVLRGIQFEEHTISLEPGDCVVFYTDGVTEAFSPESQMYGEEHLREVIQMADTSSAQALLEDIDRSVLAHIGYAAPSDDLTLLVLRRDKDQDVPTEAL